MQGDFLADDYREPGAESLGRASSKFVTAVTTDCALDHSVAAWNGKGLFVIEGTEQIPKLTLREPVVTKLASRREDVLSMSHVIVVREWDSDLFHRRVLELEAVGYVAQRETYSITPEMNPETGEIIHLHAIELCKPEADNG